MTTYIWALYAREVKRFQKIWLDTVASPVVSMVLFLTIFGVAVKNQAVVGVDFMAFVYAGLLGMMMVNSSFSNPAFALILSKNVGTIVDVQLAPIAPWQVGIAYALAAFTRGLFTIAIAILLTVWFIPGISFEHILIFILALVLTGLQFGMVGVIIGLLIKNFETFTLVMTFIMQPMIFLAGIFYPLNNLPAPWDTLSVLNPLHHNINLIRYGIIGYADTSPMISLLVIIGLSTLLFIIMNRIAVRSLKQ